MKTILQFIRSNWEGIIACIALVLSFFSFFYTREQSNLSEKLAHLHVVPQIECLMYSEPNMNPKLFIINKGPEDAVSISLKSDMFIFSEINNRVEVASSSGGPIFNDDDKTSILAHGKSVNVGLVRGKSDIRDIYIYFFHINFFRKTDMQHFNTEAIYFIHNNKIFSHKDFISRYNYHSIMAAIQEYKKSSQYKELISNSWVS